MLGRKLPRLTLKLFAKSAPNTWLQTLADRFLMMGNLFKRGIKEPRRLYLITQIRTPDPNEWGMDDMGHARIWGACASEEELNRLVVERRGELHNWTFDYLHIIVLNDGAAIDDSDTVGFTYYWRYDQDPAIPSMLPVGRWERMDYISPWDSSRNGIDMVYNVCASLIKYCD